MRLQRAETACLVQKAKEIKELSDWKALEFQEVLVSNQSL
jgi:hypothetical protein